MTKNVLMAQLRDSASAQPHPSSAAAPSPLSTSEPVLTLQSIMRQFANAARPAVAGVSLTLSKGELLGLLGPSGCGKTTLLRLIAGFDRPQAGQIELDGAEVAGTVAWVPPEKRGIGMVFQDYALFPHLTVAQNVAFGLRPSTRTFWRRSPFAATKRYQRVSEVLDLVGLDGMERRYPHQLSGGQQQRVALARALAPNPPMVLLDEPLSNLDAKVRLQLRQDLRDILKAAGATGIFVTHDQEEALSICDRVAVMRQGRLEQLGTPQELYQQPTSRFVVEFVVQANVVPAYSQGDVWSTDLGQFAKADIQSPLAEESPAPTISRQPDQPDADLMIRQEDIQLHACETSDIVIRDRQFLGRENRYCLLLPSQRTIVARVPADVQYAIGTSVNVGVNAESVCLFPHAYS